MLEKFCPLPGNYNHPKFGLTEREREVKAGYLQHLEQYSPRSLALLADIKQVDDHPEHTSLAVKYGKEDPTIAEANKIITGLLRVRNGKKSTDTGTSQRAGSDLFLWRDTLEEFFPTRKYSPGGVPTSEQTKQEFERYVPVPARSRIALNKHFKDEKNLGILKEVQTRFKYRNEQRWHREHPILSFFYRKLYK